MRTFKILLIISTLFYSTDGLTQVNYQQPHEDILQLIDAPLPPSVSMNTEGTKAALFYRRAYKDINELSEPELRLAGLRINPKTNISSRARYYFDVKVLDTKSRKTMDVKGLPEVLKLTNIRWSHDESMVAFTNTEKEGVALWILDINSLEAKKITAANLNANIGSPFSWMKDDKSFIVKELPNDRPELINVSSAVPAGPTITESDGRKAQNRTYQDLLKNPNDEKNFETLAKSTLKKVMLDGTTTSWMKTAMYSGMSFSPDGSMIMLTTVDRPFSYLVPYRRFARHTDIYTMDGKLVKNVQNLPLIEDLPSGFGATHTHERNYSWRADKPATLTYVQAMDGGDPSAEVAYRDGLYEREAPFNGEGILLAKTVNRYSYTKWGNDNTAIIHDRWWKNRNTKAYAFNPSNPDQSPTILWDRSYQDNYGNPGNAMTEDNKYGRSVLALDGDNIFLTGRGYSDEGIHPFIDKLNIKTNKKDRLYQAKKNEQLENIRGNLDIKKGMVLTSLEAQKEYPNYYFRNIKSGKLTPITSFENPFKAIQDIHKEIISYKREDV